MANLREFTYPSSDGIHQVHAAEWTPENGSPRAVLQLVHGISEYIMRYDGFARFLAEAGFVVCGHDHRFGWRGEGNPARLQELCTQLGMGCDVVQKVTQEVAAGAASEVVDQSGLTGEAADMADQLAQEAIRQGLSALPGGFNF